MEVRGFDKSRYKNESVSLMERVGLLLTKDTLVEKLFKGYEERLAVAQSLIGDPDLCY